MWKNIPIEPRPFLPHAPPPWVVPEGNGGALDQRGSVASRTRVSCTRSVTFVGDWAAGAPPRGEGGEGQLITTPIPQGSGPNRTEGPPLGLLRDEWGDSRTKCGTGSEEGPIPREFRAAWRCDAMRVRMGRWVPGREETGNGLRLHCRAAGTMAAVVTTVEDWARGVSGASGCFAPRGVLGPTPTQSQLPPPHLQLSTTMGRRGM